MAWKEIMITITLGAGRVSRGDPNDSGGLGQKSELGPHSQGSGQQSAVWQLEGYPTALQLFLVLSDNQLSRTIVRGSIPQLTANSWMLPE